MRRLTRLLMVAALLGTIGCGETAKSGGTDCDIERYDAQPSERFRAGNTYWLPTRIDPCDGARWQKVSGPKGANVVDPGPEAKGRPRLTPTHPGSYTLRLGDTDRTVELTVVAPDQKPFVNYPYFGSRSQAIVDGQLWVANVYSPSISRMNPSSLERQGQIRVGPYPVALAYRSSMAHAVVAQRANDTLGFIDADSHRLVDAVWVGDEPSNVVLSSDGSRAYVALTTEGKVAVVDTDKRRLVERIDVNRDPLAMAISPDDETLYVATHRSGHVERGPYDSYDPEKERDIAAVALAAGEVDRYFKQVGTTLNAMTMSPDGKRLYLAGRTNATQPSLSNTDEPNFFHRVFILSPETGEVRTSVDLSRQKSAGGHAVAAHGMALTDETLWVTAEGSNAVLALDPTTLAEKARAEVAGRPRSVVPGPDGTRVFVHGTQAFEVAAVDGSQSVTATGSTGEDPRPADVAEGQRYFTGAGEKFAKNWSCNSCHGDMLTDTLIWNAGPFEDKVVSKPFFWLEGTDRLGWAGYLSNVRNYSYEVNNNVGVRPRTEQANNLDAFLSSIMPPPAANGWTRPDGSLSETGRRGKKLFEGEAGCTGCHPGSLTTNRKQFDEGITGGISDVPALVGTYRHNVWLKHGEATTLRGAVVRAAEYAGTASTLSDSEVDDLTRYVRELTGREFFVLSSRPTAGSENVPVGRPLELTFSKPVWASEQNLAAIELRDTNGRVLETKVELSEDGRHATVTPAKDLAFGTRYELAIEASLSSFGERTIGAEETIAFETAAEPELELDGTYKWVVDMPVPDFENNRFDPDQTVENETTMTVEPSPSGGDVTVDFGDGLAYETRAVVDGKSLDIPPMPVAIRDSFADTTGIEGKLNDKNGDGIADRASGTLVMSGPGFQVEGVSWKLERPDQSDEDGDCATGPAGDKVAGEPLSFETDEKGRPVVSWKDKNEKA
ncbi:MAG: Ig-like domain-containing protein, partial [Bradymonadaceae bacterium]